MNESTTRRLTSQARRSAAPTTFFLAAKALAAGAPLALGLLLPSTTYGKIEWALATGNLLAFLVDGGFTSAYPYFTLHRPHPTIAASTRAWHIPILFAGVSVSLLVASRAAYATRLAVTLTGVFSLSRFVALTLKTHGRPVLASLWEGVPYIPILIVAPFALINKLPTDALAVLYWSAIVTYFAAVLRTVSSHGFTWRIPSRHSFAAAARHAFTTWPAAAGLVGITLASRTLGPVFLDDATYGVFALHFRIVSSAMLIQQLLVTLHFKWLYTAGDRAYGRAILGVGATILSIGLAFALILPPLFRLLGFETLAIHSNLLVAVTGLVALWALTAQLEMVVYRERLMRWQLAGAALAGSFLFLAGVIGIQGLHNYVLIQALALGFLIAAQAVGTRHRQALGAGSVMTVTLSALGFATWPLLAR